MTTDTPTSTDIVHADTTLADLVTAAPRLAPLLGELGLDFCCGGRRTLAAACAEAGIALDDTRERLTAALAAPEAPDPAVLDLRGLGPAALVDHLEATHHRYLHAELEPLAALAAKVAAVHGERHPELRDVAATVDALRADLEPHLAKEERILFPMIRELAAAAEAPAFHCGTLANPIRVMEADHDRAGELLADLRRLTDDYAPPADGCASYRDLYARLARLEADTHLHVHAENNLLFPAVVALEADRRAQLPG